MKTRLLLSLFGTLLAGAVGISGNALAQGQGGGGGGGGGGGDAAVTDFGDLIILNRWPSGVPVLTDTDCQQPIAFPENVGCPAEDLIWDVTHEVWLVPVNPDTCAVNMAHATCTNEADFGRTNLARSSDAVLTSQLEDVIINLAVADCTSLDPAGRLVYSNYIGTELMTGTVDSPLQNLAVYRQLVRTGTIYEGLTLPQGATALDTAARGLGVAMDKAGKFNVDLLVYLNEILGLTEGTTMFEEPNICINVKEEVEGSMEYVEKCFLNYSGYLYNRASVFGALPSPAYIPATDSQEGFFEFLARIEGTDTYQVVPDSIMTTVFNNDPGFTDGDIGGFVQAADDTREVINFMHNWAVPVDAKTAVPCTATPDPTGSYDLSISAKSGLKVPKRVIPTTEGREFTVIVANAGPDLASGTLTVTAEQGAGGDVLVEGNPGPFIFEFEGLLPGMSYTTTRVFSIAEPHERTAISWEAEVVHGEFGVDPYTVNNTATATTLVR